MSPIGFGNTFGIASEFTNEIYDISNEANQAAVKEGGDTWTMILGIVVTLLPKVFHLYFDTILIFSNYCAANLEVDLSYLDVFHFQIIPRIMPSIVGEDKIKERFDNGGGEMEHIFREKFLQNLNVSFFY